MHEKNNSAGIDQALLEQTTVAPESNAGNAATAPAEDTQMSAAGNGRHLKAPNFSTRVNSVPATTVQFSAENGLRYQSPVTGTTVTIPARSLVDQNGNPVLGEAELQFREYRTIEEFLASGIPMHYGDGRGDFFFNSGGMFEVRVSQNGEPVQMAPGKVYDIAFSPTENLEDVSLYYLDDNTGKWGFKPSEALGQASLTEPPVVTERTAVANNTRTKGCIPVPLDLGHEPDPAELVKTAVKTGLELATGKRSLPMWFKKNPALTDDQLLFRMEKGLIQIKKHRDQSQLFFPEDLNKFFTELSAFKDCYFTYNADSLGGVKKAKMVTAGDYWQRITVKQVSGANCVITLYDGKDGQMQFHAVLSGSTENKSFNPERVMAEYHRLRDLRHRDFAQKNKELRYFLYASLAFQEKSEWCYSAYEWIYFFEQNRAMMARRYDALAKKGLDTDDVLAAETWRIWLKTLREQRFENADEQPIQSSKKNLEYALHLSSFGIYNLDQIFRIGGEGSQFVVAEYRTQTGDRIVPAYVSIVERRTRLFFTLPSSAKLLSSPGRKLDVIVTDRNGRQYHFPAAKYGTQYFHPEGMTVLTLNDVTDLTQSPKAWADLLEI
jgi:hypothetical protein